MLEDADLAEVQYHPERFWGAILLELLSPP